MGDTNRKEAQGMVSQLCPAQKHDNREFASLGLTRSPPWKVAKVKDVEAIDMEVDIQTAGNMMECEQDQWEQSESENYQTPKWKQSRILPQLTQMQEGGKHLQTASRHSQMVSATAA